MRALSGEEVTAQECPQIADNTQEGVIMTEMEDGKFESKLEVNQEAINQSCRLRVRISLEASGSKWVNPKKYAGEASRVALTDPEGQCIANSG